MVSSARLEIERSSCRSPRRGASSSANPPSAGPSLSISSSCSWPSWRRRWPRTRQRPSSQHRRRALEARARPAAQAGPPAAAGASAARAHRLSRTCSLPSAAAPVRKLGEDITETLECVPRQWKVVEHVREKFALPALRGDHPAAGAIASDRARARRAEPARPCAVRQVRPAPAAQPAERDLCPRRHRARCLDAGRLGGRCGRDPDAAGAGDPHPCLRRRAHPRRRHHRAGAGQGADEDRALWTYVRDDRPFGGPDPPAAVFFYSPDRGGEHPEQHLAGFKPG